MKSLSDTNKLTYKNGIDSSDGAFADLLLSFILFIRKNGHQFVQNSSSIHKRQLVYLNLIWLTTFAGVVVYITGTSFINSTPALLFWGGAVGSGILFISFYLLVKKGKIFLAKNWLIITTYGTVMYFDSLTNSRAFVYLCMFAYLPAAMNIFFWSTQKRLIIFYSLFPLFYFIATQALGYSAFQKFDIAAQTLRYQVIYNLILAFTLWITFSAYMVFNSVAKQKKLTLQRMTLQSTLDNSDAAIWSIDKQYNLTAANSKYLTSIEKIFGLEGLQIGDNIRRHELWSHLPQMFKEEYKSVFEGRDVLHEVELNGDIYMIQGVPVLDGDSKILGATFVSRNITKKKKDEEALRTAKRLAEETSNAKARFISNMSHELRTPLNGIIGITRILKDEKVLPEQQEHLNTLQDLSEHTLQLINNILDFAKVEAGKATLESRRFGLRRFLDKMTSIFQGTARLKGIRFEVNRLGETDIYVNGDEIRLSQVLINLIGNAFKFTEKGSVILSCNAEIQKNNCAEIRFSIQDTGIGIKQENLSRIFESFSQADANTTRKFGGTGLGLSIGEKILGLMGAKLNVKSEYGKGTEFCFSLLLPVSSKTDAMPLFETNNPGADKDLTGVNILLAEDNKVNQVVACRLLQKMNATVSVVSNGKEATEYNGIHDMSVILMDLDMPVMDGYESTYLIKKKHPGTPVIALTAASFDDMHNYLSRKGFDEVVQKPFVPDDLLSKIQAVMKKSA